jgi:hypothetical protein
MSSMITAVRTTATAPPAATGTIGNAGPAAVAAVPLKLRVTVSVLVSRPLTTVNVACHDPVGSWRGSMKVSWSN